MTETQAVTREAVDVVRRFVEAFNDRDLDALRHLVTDETEFRRLDGKALRGQDGARALVEAARDMDLRLVTLRRPEVDRRDDAVVVTWPVRELIGPDDIERTTEFEIRDGRIVAFTTRPME